jgi:hypothetical protein
MLLIAASVAIDAHQWEKALNDNQFFVIRIFLVAHLYTMFKGQVAKNTG